MNRVARAVAVGLCVVAGSVGTSRADLVDGHVLGQPEASPSAAAADVGTLRFDGAPDLAFLDSLLRPQTAYTTFSGGGFSVELISAASAEPGADKAMAIVSRSGGVLVASSEPSTGGQMRWGPVTEGTEDTSQPGAITESVASLGLPKSHDDAEGSDEWVLVLTSATDQQMPGADGSGTTVQSSDLPSTVSTSSALTVAGGGGGSPGALAPSGGSLGTFAALVPEPSSVALLALGFVGLAGFVARKRLA